MLFIIRDVYTKSSIGNIGQNNYEIYIKLTITVFLVLIKI